MSRSSPITLPLESDAEAKIQGFPDDGDIRIRLVLGGFIRAGLFRFALEKAASGEKIVRGPVEITVVRAKKTVMEVAIRLPKGELVKHTFEDETIGEIIERVDQVRSLLHSYAPDPTAMKIADEKRREIRPEAA